MLTRRILRFKALPKKGDDLCYWVKSMLDDMIDYGYAMRVGNLVTLNADRSEVTMHVTFTGKDAWKHYQASFDNPDRDYSPESGALHRPREVAAMCVQGPQITEFKVASGSSVPSCKCKGDAFPLIVWATPSTGCPPLICPVDSVLPVYRLGISDDLWGELKKWEAVTLSLADVWLRFSLQGTPVEVLQEAASKDLLKRAGWVAQKGSAIARKLQRVLKRPVSCPTPAVNLFRL